MCTCMCCVSKIVFTHLSVGWCMSTLSVVQLHHSPPYSLEARSLTEPGTRRPFSKPHPSSFLLPLQHCASLGSCTWPSLWTLESDPRVLCIHSKYSDLLSHQIENLMRNKSHTTTCSLRFFSKPTFNKHPTSPLAHDPPEVVEKKGYQDMGEIDMFINSSLGASPIFVVRISSVQSSSKHQIRISSCSPVLLADTTHEPARVLQSRRSRKARQAV